MTTATTKKTASKYSAAQEQRIRDFGPLNQAAAEALAVEFGAGFTARSVIAKINRMGLPYERKGKVTKSGDPVEHKDDLVKEIATFVTGNLDGLEKAPKPALQAIRNFLAA